MKSFLFKMNTCGNTHNFIEMLNENMLECAICGKNHKLEECNYVKIAQHVPDSPVPPRAKLTLPPFLEINVLSDGTYSVKTKSFINAGTKFGPFEAEKMDFLNPSILFPLKIFDRNQNDRFLNSCNEEKCNWLMYVSSADSVEEQNLVCYQDKQQIYYVTIKDINVDEFLKVWYAPHYATHMNKQPLPSKSDAEYILKNIDVNALIKTQQKIMNRKTWTCKFCSKIESDVVTFARHILNHYSAHHKNMCEICQKTFGSKRNLKNHMKFIHKMYAAPKPKAVNVNEPRIQEAPLGGPLLNDMFTDSTDLQQSFDLSLDDQNLLIESDSLAVDNLLNENVKDLDHFNFEINDDQKQFVCDICLKEFSKVKLLIVHLRHHTGDFICHICLKVFCRKENLTSHVCYLSTPHSCSFCEKTFTQKKYLYRHIQAVHNKKYHCASCRKDYYSNKELSEHNCSKVPSSEKEKFVCSICDKFFYRDIYLKKHLKCHQQNPNTATTCDVCGVHLEHRNSYYLHKKTHLESSISCDVCKKKFSRTDSLKEHVLAHKGAPQIRCDVCDKSFKSIKLLRAHFKTHITTRNVKCPVCDLNLKNQKSLVKHLKVHNEKIKRAENYECPICNKQIKLRSSLLRHLRKIHPNDSVNGTNFCTKRANTDKDTSNDGKLENIVDDGLINNNQSSDALKEEVGSNDDKVKEAAKEICLSIPDLGESDQEITLDKNAYILENGTIIQPQGDSDNVIIYVLDHAF